MTETVETPEVLEEKRYEYQPTDDNGIPMGGPQVIKYKTTDELIAKLQENNVRLQRKLREANRKNRTGQFEPEEIPSEAPKFSEPINFIPEDLSADELIAITQDITNPAKVREAYRRLSKAEYGATPDQIREALIASQKAAQDNLIRVEVDKFLVNNPDYYVCTENWNTIYNWMDKYNLGPIEANLTLAYHRLSDILLRGGGTIPNQGVKPEEYIAPVTLPENVTPSLPVANYDNTSELGGKISIEPVEIVNFDPSVTAPVAPVQRVSTSLTNTNTSSGTPLPPVPGSDIVYVSPNIIDSKGRVTNPARTYVGLKALDAMPPEEYQRRFNSEPGFKEKVDKLLSSRKINPNQR